MSRPHRVELMMALHHACRPSPFPEDNPATREVYARWLSLGFVTHASQKDQDAYGSVYAGTEALTVWTEALMNVRRPERLTRWEVPQ